jgi:VWFA-related protein
MLSRACLRTLALVALAAATLAAQSKSESGRDARPSTPSLRITSPQGRTGTVTRIRIVAQVDLPSGVLLSPVDFLVDGEKVGTVEHGPPWAVEWIDDNPLLQREIMVQATDANGTVLRDHVTLPAYEVTDETEVTGVLLETSVYDADGRYVSDLPTDSFAVVEDQIQQVVDLITRETVPNELVILVDNSQSMSARMDFVRGAVERLSENLRPKDRAMVVPFNTHIGSVTGPTSDKATVAQAITAMQAGGGTALLDSVREATHLVANAEGRRAIVLITDGFDENSEATVDEVIEAIDRAGVTVYAIGIGGSAGISLRGQDTIRQLVARSGGRAYFPPQERDLVTAVRSITTESQSRFLISYTPTNQKKDGRWRDVKVQVPDGYKVRTRAGYFAPAPPPIRPTVEFTILDASRRYVDVTKEDLEVLEDNVPQTISTFQEAVDPVSIVLTLDASGSMKKDAELLKSTAKHFVVAVRPEDSLALITFADRPKFEHVLSLNRQWSFDAIDRYTPLGGTALYDGLWNSLSHLKGIAGRRAVVVLTDGRDENNPGTAPGSLHTLDEVLALQREVNASIFAIGFGANVDGAVLERLAEVSGGQSYFASDAETLSTQFTRIVQDLRRRYIVSYTSTNDQHDGTWRTIDVRPKNPGAVVLTSGGYFAPDK